MGVGASVGTGVALDADADEEADEAALGVVGVIAIEELTLDAEADDDALALLLDETTMRRSGVGSGGLSRVQAVAPKAISATNISR